MANSLLDFVMSLVSDPDAAAAYAADPAQAIADANLTDVTSVDVNDLIPVVAESLSTAVPSTGADGLVDDPSGNVWTSGAATAAFDAFDDHVPAIATDDVHSVVAELVSEPDAGVQAGLDALCRRRGACRCGRRRPVAAVRRPGHRRCADRRARRHDDWSQSVPRGSPSGCRLIRLRHLRLVTAATNTEMRGPYGSRILCV